MDEARALVGMGGNCICKVSGWEWSKCLQALMESAMVKGRLESFHGIHESFRRRRTNWPVGEISFSISTHMGGLSVLNHCLSWESLIAQ